MSKLLGCFCLLLIGVYLFFTPASVAAAGSCIVTFNPDPSSTNIEGTNTTLSVTFHTDTLAISDKYSLYMTSPRTQTPIPLFDTTTSNFAAHKSFDTNGNITVSVNPGTNNFWEPGQYLFFIVNDNKGVGINEVNSRYDCEGNFTLTEKPAQPSCKLSILNSSIDNNTNVSVGVSGLKNSSDHYEIWVDGNPISGQSYYNGADYQAGKNSFSIGSWSVGPHTVALRSQCNQIFGQTFMCLNQLQCSYASFNVVSKGQLGGGPVDIAPITIRIGCTNNCSTSKGASCDNGTGISTAVGCIHTSVPGLTTDLLKFATGISGGFAFLMMLLGAFQMLTSAGNPETLNAGRERLTSAIIGLLLIIFAVLLLQIIGVDLLGLPQFGR